MAAQAALAVQIFLENNSVNPSLLEGENGANLFAYVLMGEVRGENENVFRLGDRILSQLGLNRYEKVRTDLPSVPSTVQGNEAGSTTPVDNTRVITPTK